MCDCEEGRAGFFCGFTDPSLEGGNTGAAPEGGNTGAVPAGHPVIPAALARSQGIRTGHNCKVNSFRCKAPLVGEEGCIGCQECKTGFKFNSKNPVKCKIDFVFFIGWGSLILLLGFLFVMLIKK